MSRIGRKPIVIPAGVTVTVDEAEHTVTVKGPKGSLNSNYHPLMTVKVEGNEVLVSRPNDEPQARSLHGLTRTNIANMVNGVVNGYEKKLEIVGVGLRCQKQGSIYFGTPPVMAYCSTACSNDRFCDAYTSVNCSGISRICAVLRP